MNDFSRQPPRNAGSGRGFGAQLAKVNQPGQSKRWVSYVLGEPGDLRREQTPRPKVCFISCGGTIASRPSTKGLSPQIPAEQLLSHVPGVHSIADVSLAKFSLEKDSTNVQVEDWEVLCRTIHYELKVNSPDAFVISHGTDTMAYTSGALALAFGRRLTVPIVMTGAQIPIERVGSDGVQNLGNAFRTATEAFYQERREVMICFGHHVFRGSRARKRHGAQCEAFESPSCDPLVALGDAFTFAPGAWRTQDVCIPPDERSNVDNVRPLHHFDSRVVTVQLTPGFDPAVLEALIEHESIRGVVLQSFGPGNLPNDDVIGYGFGATIARAVERHVPIVITTPFVGGSVEIGAYEVGATGFENGALSALDMTVEMAAVKLMWLLGQQRPYEDLQYHLYQNIAEEVSGPAECRFDPTWGVVRWGHAAIHHIPAPQDSHLTATIERLALQEDELGTAYRRSRSKERRRALEQRIRLTRREIKRRRNWLRLFEKAGV